MSDAVERHHLVLDRILTAWFEADDETPWDTALSNDIIEGCLESAGHILSALHLTPEQASGLMDGTMVVVPREPSEAMRDIGEAVAFDWADDSDGYDVLIRDVWSHMIAASQPKEADS